MKKHNDQIIKDVLYNMIKEYRLDSKLNQTKIRSVWKELMGPTISGYTTDIDLRRRKLFITLNSAPLKQELSMGREKIRQLLNETLGEEFIEEVIIK